MSETRGVRAVVEVLARALTDQPDHVRVTESQHKATTLVELYVAPGGRIRFRETRAPECHGASFREEAAQSATG